MTEDERRFAEDRRVRNDARANFDAGLKQVRADFGARSVPARIADKAKHEATEAMVAGLEIASQSKGIVAAVVAGTGLWWFREPLFRHARKIFQRNDPSAVQADGDSSDGD